MDDWDLVPVLSGAEPVSAAWVWGQLNEHRFPVTRLILLGLARTGGGLTTAMTLVALCLSAAAALLATATRQARGRAEYADAFFPLLLLHWGHSYNLLFPTQLVLVSAVLLGCVVLYLVVTGRWSTGPGGAALLGACLVLLPLHGGMGLTMFPALAAWAVWAAWSRRREGGARDAAILLGCAVAGCALVAAYFVGYESPSHHRPPPGAAAALRTAAEYLSVGVGPLGARLWPASGVFAAGFALLAVAALLRALRERPAERPRAAGLLLFLGAVATQALAVGVGRSALGPGAGLHERFYILAAPLLCAAYLALSLYYPPRAGRFAAVMLFAASCAALSLNMEAGMRYGQFRLQVAESLRQDVLAGAPSEALAAQYSRFLHPDQGPLAERLEMLRRARRGPFEPGG
jgi:hypothetical protein